MLIAVAGFPRSGSTWIYNVVIDLMRDQSPKFYGRADHPYQVYSPDNIVEELMNDSCINIGKVTPSHKFFGNKNLKVIFIQRDNFDVAGSAKERWFKSEKESNLLYDWYSNVYLKILHTLISHKNNPNILWLNYEEVYGNEKKLSKLICDYLDIPYKEISNEVQVNSLRNVSKNFRMQFSKKLRIKSRTLLKFLKSLIPLPNPLKEKRLFIWRRLEWLFPKYNKFLIGPDHVSSSFGKPKTLSERLTKEEYNYLKNLIKNFNLTES